MRSTTPVRFALIALGSALSLSISAAGPASAQAVSDAFLVQEGTVPVVFTFPHGGTTSVPGVADRNCSSSSKNCGRDTNTHLMGPAISDVFFALTGEKPYLVTAYVPRKQVDLNRSDGSQAYDDIAAKPYYDFYHDAVREAVDEINATFGSGVLFDVHGQSSYPGTVIRGTKNGETVTDLLAGAGPVALTGPESLFGVLASLGYPVSPDLAIPFEQQVEIGAYNGGHTVRTYGSSHADGIDAIQLEIGFDLRSGSAWDQTSIDLASATRTFYVGFLPAATSIPALAFGAIFLVVLLGLCGAGGATRVSRGGGPRPRAARRPGSARAEAG